MYESLINEMVEHFSEEGLILYSKACDFSKLFNTSMEDIEMYYDILCSDEEISKNIERDNHKMCCLYYLSKKDPKYIDIFMTNYFSNVDFQNIEKNVKTLIMTFNIIEFDKTYNNSPIQKLKYIYSILRTFSNFETNFQNFIIYKYYRGYLKLRLLFPFPLFEV